MYTLLVYGGGGISSQSRLDLKMHVLIFFNIDFTKTNNYSHTVVLTEGLYVMENTRVSPYFTDFSIEFLRRSRQTINERRGDSEPVRFGNRASCNVLSDT